MSEDYMGVRGYATPSPEQQRNLIERVKAGDKDARETFIRSNMNTVFSVADKYCEMQNRDDVYQEGAIKLWKLAEQYDPEKGEFFTLAVISLKRKFSDLAKTERKKLADYVDVYNPEFSTRFKTYDAFKDMELYEQICEEVKQLPLHQRAVMTFRYGLFYDKPMPLKEVCRHLSMSSEIVSKHEKKALKTLRERLQRST
jgi:RNA polymerase sporulation-specific sigma factor